VTFCSPEAIAYANGWITKEKLAERAELFHKTSYGKYLKSILEG
jgi:glucose-1-phosphate thymidylyltransferase